MKYLLLILCVHCASTVVAQKKGDKLWVISSGAYLREKPDETSKVVDSVRRGQTVIWEASQNNTHSMRLIKGLELNGHWAQVKYKKKSGYMFAKLLSNKLVLPNDNQSLGDYFSTNYKKVSAIESKPITPGGGSKATSETIITTTAKLSKTDIYFILRKYANTAGDYNEAKKELYFQKSDNCFVTATFLPEKIVLVESCK